LGDVPITGFSWVDSDTLEITFESQSVTGTYEIVIGPEILDVAGNAMDQDGDSVPGEIPDDQYIATFTIEAPHVVDHTPAGAVLGPVQTIVLNFNHPMDDTSFAHVEDV
jgi:hypothetical protein